MQTLAQLVKKLEELEAKVERLERGNLVPRQVKDLNLDDWVLVDNAPREASDVSHARLNLNGGRS